MGGKTKNDRVASPLEVYPLTLSQLANFINSLNLAVENMLIMYCCMADSLLKIWFSPLIKTFFCSHYYTFFSFYYHYTKNINICQIFHIDFYKKVLDVTLRIAYCEKNALNLLYIKILV